MIAILAAWTRLSAAAGSPGRFPSCWQGPPCGQFQDRLKRRGQFWTRKGFAPFLRAYVWYMNGELEYAIDRPAA